MPLRSKLIIYAVVMLLLFAGLSVGAFLSLSAASKEAEAAREELEKLTLVEALAGRCAGMGPASDALACKQAMNDLTDLADKSWRPETRELLDRILVLAECFHSGQAPAQPEELRSSVALLRSQIVTQVKDDLRDSERPTHRRATRLLVAACLIAVGGSGTFAWLYARIVRERRSLEERVQRSGKLAALGTLAAGIAHEINNPLATISMSAEAVADRVPDDPDARSFCQAIQEETSRCRDIIEDLSDLARGDSVDREPVDAAELVSEVERIVERNAKLPAARLACEVPEGLPFVSADRGKLLQVLVNLVQNGMEAAGEGGKVHLAARHENGRFSFTITDNGRGIPPDLLERIFEPFFTDHKSSGVGLGLTLCHRIAELHGGDLKVESPGPGRGSTFTLTLPQETPGDAT